MLFRVVPRSIIVDGEDASMPIWNNAEQLPNLGVSEIRKSFIANVLCRNEHAGGGQCNQSQFVTGHLV
jgi:hypothetical protein